MQKKMRILPPLSNGVRWRKNVDEKIEVYISNAREGESSFIQCFLLKHLLTFVFFMKFILEHICQNAYFCRDFL